MLTRQRFLAGVCLSLTIALGCNLVVSRTGLQCMSDEDCTSSGAAFENTRCSSRGTCEAVVVPEGGIFDGSCSTSLQCQLALKGAARCVVGQCVSLEPGNGLTCRYLGQPERDDAMVFGVLLPMNGQAASEFAVAESVVLRVVEAWNSAPLSGAARPLGAVVCDEGAEGALTLLKKLSPPFILGPFVNASGRKLLTNEQELLLFSPTMDDSSLAQVDVRRRLVSCSPNATLAVGPTQSAIGLIRDRLREQGTETPKMVLVHTQDEGDTALATAIETGLMLDGTQAGTSASYKRESIPYNPLVDTTGQLPVVADTIAREKPDLVVLTNALVADPFVKALDNRWRGRNGAYPLPKILLLGSSELLSVYLKTRGNVEAGRYFAVDWARTPAQTNNWEALRSALAAFSGVSNVPRAAGFTNDCIYTALYSALAGAASAGTTMNLVDQTRTNTGLDLATGGDDNTTVRLVSDDIPKAIGFLGTVPLRTKLIGANADLGLLPTRTPAGSSVLLCISSTGDRAGEWTSSSVSFDPTTGKANGSISCN